MFAQSFFHGTKAALAPGDLIAVGYRSNFTDAKSLSWVYFTGTLDAAIWGARIGGWRRNGTNLCRRTDRRHRGGSEPDGYKKFPGNLTLS